MSLATQIIVKDCNLRDKEVHIGYSYSGTWQGEESILHKLPLILKFYVIFMSTERKHIIIINIT